ncbi:MAG: TetR/AcrR family transcriptional regulator [Streptosporangiaceae bacterium]
MSIHTGPESRRRGRTRGAILTAAASVLARDRAATLPEVAEAADVGRTTLHRYFPDRESLIEATFEDSIQAIQQSMVDAALDQGSPLDAMRRLVAAMVAVGDHLLFVFGDPRVPKGNRTRDGAAPTDPVIDLIKRGQAEGLFDSEVSATWIQHVLWVLVYRGCEDADMGELPRHGITATVVRTLENGIHVR